jgi:hypothetical protein
MVKIEGIFQTTVHLFKVKELNNLKSKQFMEELKQQKGLNLHIHNPQN